MSLSHPGWLAERWLDRYGFDAAEAWEQFNNAAAPLTLRVNRLKTDREALTRALREHGVDVEPARYAPDGLIVTSGNPLRTPLAGTGQFFLQDEASQLVALLGAPEPGMRVLDTCASPGGKTTAMAAMAGDRARDRRDRRAQRARTAASRNRRRQRRAATSACCRPISRRACRSRAEFDVVFVDAPCSGLGTVRRDPDIRWRRAESDLAPLARAQLTMIRNAAEAVRPGGRLIYATCSSEPEENDAWSSAFLEANAGFAADRSATPNSPRTSTRSSPCSTRRGVLRTSPHKHGLEAFYGAVLRRVK